MNICIILITIHVISLSNCKFGYFVDHSAAHSATCTRSFPISWYSIKTIKLKWFGFIKYQLFVPTNNEPFDSITLWKKIARNERIIWGWMNELIEWMNEWMKEWMNELRN